MADPDHTSSEAERAAEWSPAELDRLEDALERWTAADKDVEDVEGGDSSLAPRMRERLESYRDLLAMTRAELPMEEVPEGLLAGVLAEAARSGAPDQREIKVAEAARVGFWERLRRSMLLPGVALAGSAALLLWAVQPGEELSSANLDLQAANTAPARLAPGPSPAPAAAQEPERVVVEEAESNKEARAEEQQAAPAAPSSAAAGAAADAKPEAESDDLGEEAKGRKVKSMKKAETSVPGEYLPGLDDVPTDTGADKDELRDTLEVADRARRKGRCGEAIKIYLSAMSMSGPRNEQAQARAGYALCLQTLGDDAKATKYFEAASKMSPSIDGWVKRERGDSSPKKAPAKPSSRVQADDPFN